MVEGVVVKRFVGAGARRRLDVEVAALTAPVRLFPLRTSSLAVDVERRTGSLRHRDGSHGQDVIDRAGASVLRVAGEMARRSRHRRRGGWAGATPDLPACRVRGDFGPQNLLVDADETSVVGVLDWEFAHVDGPLENLMSAEMSRSIRVAGGCAARAVPSWEARVAFGGG